MQLFHSICKGAKASGKRASRRKGREKESGHSSKTRQYFMWSVCRAVPHGEMKRKKERKKDIEMTKESIQRSNMEKAHSHDEEKERESTVHKIQSATFQRLTINNTCVYLSKHTDQRHAGDNDEEKKMPMKRSRTCMYIVYISCNEFISRIHSTHALLDTQSVRVFHNFLSFSQWMHCFVCWICIVFFVRPHCCSFHSLMKFFILHFFIKDNKQLWCCNCDRKMNIFKTKQSSHKVLMLECHWSC